jgi:co-chaperonin GroES (HSP10)
MIINADNFKPLRGLVLIRRDEPESESDGIFIPDNVQLRGWRATVIRSGPDATTYINGDSILFLKEYTILRFQDRALAITDAKHILAKLLVKKNVEQIIPQNKFVLIEPHPLPAKIASLYLSDKSKSKRLPKTGRVIRVGPDCHDVKPHYDVWFETGKGVNCVEDGDAFKLIDEENIIAMRNGGAL